jgi:hypothetical protein
MMIYHAISRVYMDSDIPEKGLLYLTYSVKFQLILTIN